MPIIFDGTNGITSPGGDTSNTSHSTPIVRSPSSLTLQTNGSTTAVTIDTSQNVGIGTTNPSAFSSTTNLAVGTGSSTASLTVFTGTSQTGAVYFADGSSGADRYRGAVEYLHGSNALAFTTDAAERMRVDSSGRVTTPFQPAFFAHHTEGGNSSKPRTSEWTSGAYSSVPLNRGNHFSGARFTAPVTGLYYFHFWVQEETFYGNWTTPISIYWWKNGSIAFSYGIDNPGIQESENEAWIAGSIVIELAANDSFSASLYAPNASTGGNPWITTELNSGGFMGYLIG